MNSRTVQMKADIEYGEGFVEGCSRREGKKGKWEEGCHFILEEFEQRSRAEEGAPSKAVIPEVPDPRLRLEERAPREGAATTAGLARPLIGRCRTCSAALAPN